ncbi:hypothetical protein [Aggregatibacter actinomycetemcomitans]|uniref:hypothetical protein n=2 Tax=Aggregatibacter actinomycetemcomitans TaxID=714 RepID=UPI001E619429|nr:hypothetical protein [Aggregatibacter actinomycetemcomitans]
MFHFITHLFSRPFSHVERYDSIRVDTCVKQIISNVHVSMICEQWLYNVLIALKSYYSRLPKKDKNIFITEALKQGFDISESSLQKSAREAQLSIEAAYADLYDDTEDDDF